MGKSKKAVAPKKKRGGPRTGAGRKPVDEPKKPITIYVKESSIERHGGEIALKELLTAVAESPAFREASIVMENKPAPTEGFKKTFPPSDADIKAAGIPKETKPFAPETSKILDQIAAIRAEKIPESRNTPLGKRSWELDQRKRIEELQNKLK